MGHIVELGEGWEVIPAGGATGEAYIATHDGIKKLFLKRNSSPFLAVLSAEGIVPKLIWTKRMENGDVITAQQWLNGRELKQLEMKGPDVAKLLKKIHSSKELLNMLQRMGKDSIHPRVIVNDIDTILSPTLKKEPIILKSLDFLKRELPFIDFDEKVVCHCDVNHNNWLLGDDKELYLIDWDGAMIADPALDLGLLLYWYIPKTEWEDWLNSYGLILTTDLKRRMKWYVISQTVLAVEWHSKRNEIKEKDQWLYYLEQLLL